MKKFLHHFLVMVSVSLIYGCATLPPSTTTSNVPLADLCKKYNIQWQFDNVTQVVLLDYKNSQAKALIGSSVVLIGEQKITLSGPVMRLNSSIYVPYDFETKVIGPAGAVSTGAGYSGRLANLKVHTIVLDAGHGGKDPGAKGTSSGVKEKEVALDITQRLKRILEDAGLTIIMTRESDTYPTLPQRTEMASKNEIDLFVSIHANSNPSKRMEGIEVYYAKTKTKKDLDEEQRQKNERRFVKNLDASSNSAVSAIVGDMMYQLKVAESSKLASRIVRDVSSQVGMPNRGIRQARFFVVRNTLMPAVLIETGFLTNRHEERKLNSSSYRQKLAESIARSILAYASS
jgi:N-acetylmuramoyl-L-alanine amidase